MRRFWLLHLWSAWSFSVGCVEAGCHIGDRSEGLARIRAVRAHVEDTGEWPAITWWTPKADGGLDFASWPWVSAARGYGDCDDAMILAESILKGYDTRRAFVFAGERGHAMLLWKVGSYWYVVNNMVCTATLCTTPEEAARLYFGDATTDIIID